MRIRTKLSLSISVLFALSLGTLGFLLVSMETRRLERDNVEKTDLIQNTVERAARDALIARDDVLLVSYVKFLRERFPALTYCRITWQDGERLRNLTVGSDAVGGALERTVVVRDPTDGRRRVALQIGLSQAVLQERIETETGRLRRDLMRLFGIAIIVGFVFSDLFARTLAKPLIDLSKAAGEIGKGKLGIRLEWKSQDEIGTLVAGFNHMSQRLEELDALKKDFVSSVTHELRSPLGAIESFLNLIEAKFVNGRPANPAQFLEYMGRIKINVKRLSGFITDLLDVAKIERGKMECQLRPMRLQEVVSEVLQFFEAKGKEQGVSLHNRLDPKLSEVNGDPERVRQVLVNLVSNALKFTPAGGHVWIQGEQYREGSARFLEVAVADTGRGMDEADAQSLFQKFTQGKNVNLGVKGPKGTGLGLFIVRSIVEAHGGRVSVRSSPGKGTQFLFNLRMS